MNANAPTIHLPAPMQIRELLTGMLDRDITMGPTSPFAPSPLHPATIAVYTEDSLEIRALLLLDLPLSAYLGAAIGLVPPGGAAAALEAGGLPDNIKENINEVLNIATSLFNVDNAPHVRLYAVHPAGDEMPGHLQMMALTLGRREDMKIDIQGYGTGRFSIVLI